jgi:integrase
MTTAFTLADASRSPFAGADVCQEAGLTLPQRTRRPVFDDDRWDFTQVVGLPTQMSLAFRRLDFTAITNPRWRLVAKEQVMAMLAPRHTAVAQLPRTYRTPLHLLSVFGRLAELTRLLNWLTDHGTVSLAELDANCCERYLHHRRYLLDDNNVVVGERSPATRRAAAQAVVDLVNHRNLFTTDRVPENLRPWGGATPSAVAEMPSGRDHNKTPPLDGTVLQPLLAAATYLTTTLAAHAVDLAGRLRETEPAHRIRPQPVDADLASLGPVPRITTILNQYVQSGQPLPQLPDHLVRRRLARGWDPHDPLLTMNWDPIARQAGYWQMKRQWATRLRPAGEDAVAAAGTAKSWARDAVPVTKASGNGQAPWTTPLSRVEAQALIGIVRTAAITLLAAVSGMRAGELMELRIGACRPPEHYGDGLVRYRLASKVVKGQPLGGTDDEWVVIEPAYRAVQLLEQLHNNPDHGAPLLGRFAFDIRHKWFRNWVNGPAGQRLGLAPIPEHPVTLRALRRTLAIELAYRPGGVLAAKLHLKHIAVATTEGYASRPGGAQAELLAEVNKHEADRNLDLLWAEFRNYQHGVMPAGPGARELTELFAHIDGKLAQDDAASPKVQPNNREVLNLLTKRARTLHLATANYCWFTDPSRALCLKLAGTPTADKPLAGMCDSTRCPQATHHPCHRPVWAEHAQQTTTFLGDLGPTRKAEHARLQADLDRAHRVLDGINNATRTEKE